MNINSKKISFSILFLALTLFVYIYLAKDYTSNLNSALVHIKKLGTEVPFNLYTVRIFFIELNYATAIVLNCLIFGIGLYLLLFKTDVETKEIISVYRSKALKQIEEKKYLLRSLKVNSAFKVKSGVNFQKNVQNKTGLRAFIIISLLITFFISINTSFYISFFLPLSYYYYLELEPKSKRSLRLKAFLYPLIFAIILVLLNAQIKAVASYSYSETFSSYLGQETAMMILPYFICALLSFYYVNKKITRRGYPTYQPVYLSIVGIFVLLGVLQYLTDLYVQSTVDNFQF